MDKLHTHYDNLKVTRNAPVEVIRAAYRAMAQKYHPDINSSPAANNTMRILNEAWEVLSDPVRRAEHDKWIMTEEAKQNKQSTSDDLGSESKKKPSETSNKNQQDYYDDFKIKKLSSSPFIRFNLWLERINVQITAIAIVLTIVCAGLLWLTIDGYKTQKVFKEIEARSETPVVSKASDVPVVNEKPLKFTPLSESEKTTIRSKEKVPDFFGSGTQAQGEIKKQIDAERQEKTGYVKGAHQQPSAGLSTFTVDNQKGGGDAIARIYLNGAKPAARSIYVKAGEKFTARGLPPGNYVFRYRFVGSTKTYEADRLFPLEEITTVDGTRYSNVTVTLFRVSDGNLQTSEVSDDKF
jgi:hypothetical protein